MSVILVAEQDASQAERITRVLQSDGWSVRRVGSRAEALHNAGAQQPVLLFASATFPDAASLLATFSRSQGGPGSVVLVPEPGAERATAGDFQADQLLVKPCSEEALRQTVRRHLRNAPDPAGSLPKSGRQLSSADIFGDVLAEVEAEARREKNARRARTRKARSQTEDIERQLEETLSGVIPVSGRRRRSAPSSAGSSPAPGSARAAAAQPGPSPTADEIDDLLDQTLSSLELAPRVKRGQPAAAPIAETAAPAAEAPVVDVPIVEPAATSETQARRAEVVPPAARPDQESPGGRLPSPPAEDADLLSFEPPVIELLEPPLAFTAPPTKDRDLGTGLPEIAETAGRQPFKTQRLAAIPLRQHPVTAGDGKEFGDYTLLERVAVGGMAEVWRARRRGVEGFQKTVAIKKILAHLTDSPDFVNMLIDEAKLAAQLNHNNIIQIYDLGKVDDDFFIAMEYVDGKDLRSILNASKENHRLLPMGLGLMIVGALANALDYAHRKRGFDDRELGLVHRDVSPQNVLIGYEGEIKLCDFGIVKAVSKASTTQMGALKGKLQYMSPEQAWGRSVDGRSDVFSLGSVLFEVLTGTKLFAGDSEIGVLDAVRECRVRSPRELAPKIPDEVERIVQKALAKSPEDRYQTAGEMEHDLRTVLEGIQPTPAPKDLAAYLAALFHRRPADGGPPARSAMPTPASRDPDGGTPNATPVSASPVSATPVSATPVAETPVAEAPAMRPRGGRGKVLLAAAVVAGAVIGGGLFLTSREPAAPDPADPGAGGAPPTVQGPPAAAVAPPLASAPPTDASLPDLEQMVAEEVSKRREQIERDFEAKKRRLEEEIEKAKEIETPAESEQDPATNEAEKDRENGSR